MRQFSNAAYFIAFIIYLANIFGITLAALPSSASIAPSQPNSTFTTTPTSTQGSTPTAVQCLAYPSNGVCSKYVNYSVYTGGIPIALIESMLQNLTTLSDKLGPVNPQCVDNMFRFKCSQMYAKCDTSTTGSQAWLPACESTCTEAQQTCQQVLTAAGYASLLPNCSVPSFTYHLVPASDGNCNNIPAQAFSPHFSASTASANSTISLSVGYILPECPAPFVRDPLAQASTNNTISAASCFNGCCIPCPVQEYLYPTGWFANGATATNVIRTVSTGCALFLVISYAILPDKRSHPSLLIFEFFIALFLYSADVVFALGNPRRIQCSTDIIPSTQDNNTLCAVQGGIVIYSTLAMALWLGAVILNLHLHTVWNSQFLINKYWVLNFICWGGPLIVTAITFAYHQVKFEFFALCLVSTDWIHRLFFYPLAAVVLPSSVVHLATFVHIARIYIKASTEFEMSNSKSFGTGSQLSLPAISHRRHVVTAVKIQWRALLLALNALVAYLFYWILYLIQFPSMSELRNNKQVLAKWVTCMMTKQDQNYCANVISDYLPPFAVSVAAEAFVSLIGVVVFIIFAKRSLWREWNDWIYETRMRLKKTRRDYPSTDDQLFAM